MLESAQVDVVFGQGVDTKTNPLVLPAGKFRTLDNFELNRRGEIALRSGFAQVASIAEEVLALASHAGEALAVTLGGALARGFSGGGSNAGAVGPPATLLPIAARQAAAIGQLDCCLIDEKLYVAWLEDVVEDLFDVLVSGTMRYAVADPGTMRVTAEPALVGVSGLVHSLRLVSWRGRPWVLYINELRTELIAHRLGSSEKRVLLTPSRVRIDAFDAAVTEDGQELWVACVEMGLTPPPFPAESFWTTTHVFTESTGAMVPGSEKSQARLAAIAVWGTAGSARAAVASLGSGGVHCQWLDATGPSRPTAQLSATGSDSYTGVGICRGGDSFEDERVSVVWNDIDGDYAAMYWTQAGMVPEPPSPPIVHSLVGVQTCSRPFRYFTETSCIVSNEEGRSYALVQLSPSTGLGALFSAQPLSVALAGEGAWKPQRPVSIFPVGRDKVVTALPQVLVPVQGGSMVTGLVFDRYAVCTNAEIDGTTIFGGGMAMAYDGQKVAPVSFVLAPSVDAYAKTAGGNLSAGNYQYVGVWEWRDALGRLHQSVTSKISEIEGVADGDAVKLRLGLPRLLPLNQQGAVLSVYRTQANSTEFHWLFSADATAPATYTDKASDAEIAERAAPYTAGGVLEAVMPPSARVVHVHRRRVWLAGCENPTQVWYSREVAPKEAPCFNEGFTMTFPEAVTALGTLGEALATFSRSKIWLVFGDGPTDAGTDNTFMPPAAVMSDVGCIDPRSVVATPMGLMFQSEAGIYLLGQDRSVRYVGAPVEEVLRQYPTITSAVLIADRGQVRFTCNGQSDARIVIYYYQLDQWGTLSFATMPGSPDALQGAALAGGRYYVARSNYGQSVLREESGAHTDNGASIVGTLETGWLRFDSLQRLKRVRRLSVLGEGDADVNVQLAVDDVDEVVQEKEFPIQASRRPRMAMQLGRQKLQSLKVKMTVQGTGRGVRLTGMSFEVGLKKKVWARGPSADPKG